MIPWYKRFYQAGEGEFKSELQTDEIIKYLTKSFGTSEEQKANYSALRGFSPFAIDFFWGGYFTIKRIAVSSELGSRPLETGTRINGQIIESGKHRTVRYVASVRLGWFLVLILITLISSAFGAAGIFLGILISFGIYLVLRNMAIKDLKNIDIEIYKSLKAK